MQITEQQLFVCSWIKQLILGKISLSQKKRSSLKKVSSIGNQWSQGPGEGRDRQEGLDGGRSSSEGPEAPGPAHNPAGSSPQREASPTQTGTGGLHPVCSPHLTVFKEENSCGPGGCEEQRGLCAWCLQTLRPGLPWTRPGGKSPQQCLAPEPLPLGPSPRTGTAARGS